MRKCSQVFALFALCIVETTSVKAQALTPVESGISPDVAQSLRESAALADKVKNIIPHVEALSGIAGEGVTGAVEAIASQVISGTDAPDAAVSKVVNEIIKTDKAFDGIGGGREKLTASRIKPADVDYIKQNATSDPQRCKAETLLCNGNPAAWQSMECAISRPNSRFSSGIEVLVMVDIQCIPEDKTLKGNILAVTPREQYNGPNLLPDRGNIKTYSGYAYSAFCMPCARNAPTKPGSKGKNCIGEPPLQFCFDLK